MAKSIVISCSVDGDVLKSIDTYCSEVGLTRSALISTACSQYISAMRKIPDVVYQLEELKKSVAILQEKNG